MGQDLGKTELSNAAPYGVERGHLTMFGWSLSWAKLVWRVRGSFIHTAGVLTGTAGKQDTAGPLFSVSLRAFPCDLFSKVTGLLAWAYTVDYPYLQFHFPQFQLPTLNGGPKY